MAKNLFTHQKGGRMSTNPIKNVSALILKSNHITFLTGSGLSTQSGIPDYRGKTSLYWKKYEGNDYNYQNFIRSEQIRQKYWEMSADFYQFVQNATPSIAHMALSKLADLGKIQSIITQNVDGLHQKAGNVQDSLLEIHGSIHHVICLDCSTVYQSKYIYERIQKGIRVPYCDYCRGILKPAVIDFGQPLPRAAMAKALKRTLDCDLFIAIGSSLIIQPAATLPIIAKEHGKIVVIINDNPTACDQYAQHVLYGECGDILTQIVAEVSPKICQVSPDVSVAATG